MNKKLWAVIGLCLLLAACRTFTSRLRATTPVTLTATETARLSATGWVVPLTTRTPTFSFTPVPTTTPVTVSLPTPEQTNAPEATATSTPLSPTPTLSPPPATPEALPFISLFEANQQEVDPGDQVIFSWETHNAAQVILYAIPPSHHLPHSGWNVSPSGSFTVTIPPESRNYSEFMLYAQGEAGQHVTRGLTVMLRCPDAWFFSPEPDICPTAPIYSAAAEQHFEHGVMLWIEVQNRIIVLFEDDQFTTKYSVYEDKWDESQPEYDPAITAPDGLLQPVRGFGLVWRTNPHVRDRLGWALHGETGYDTIVQQTTRYKYNATYIRALDGNVWYLGPERSGWEKIFIF
ncbi:MAG: hypothetical protein P1S60_17800 [Anaerolineae bacterium]|nr:hypothetical protein [Anaerolineae bacterium]